MLVSVSVFAFVFFILTLSAGWECESNKSLDSLHSWQPSTKLPQHKAGYSEKAAGNWYLLADDAITPVLALEPDLSNPAT